MPDPITRSAYLRQLTRRLAPGVMTVAGALVVAVSAGTVHAAEDAASSRDTTSVAKPAPRPTDQFRVIGTDGEGLRVRAQPSLAAPILTRLPEGSVIALADGAPVEADGERWLPVRVNGIDGWSAARYLSRVEPLAPVQRKLPDDASFGDRVAALAESVIGKPYAWAGNTPDGFDCSGLVQWVYSQLGVKMPRDIAEQLDLGKKVDLGKQADFDKLRPGDLVSFEDTYTQGLSHVGIYIGDDRFVHASDEAHGVTVSNIRDAYWESRFYKAVRLKT